MLRRGRYCLQSFLGDGTRQQVLIFFESPLLLIRLQHDRTLARLSFVLLSGHQGSACAEVLGHLGSSDAALSLLNVDLLGESVF